MTPSKCELKSKFSSIAFVRHSVTAVQTVTVAQGGQRTLSVGSRTWQCCPCGTSLAGIKDARLKGTFQRATGQSMKLWRWSLNYNGDPRLYNYQKGWLVPWGKLPVQSRDGPRERPYCYRQQSWLGYLSSFRTQMISSLDSDVGHGTEGCGVYHVGFWPYFGVTFLYYTPIPSFWNGTIYSVIVC